MGINWKEVKAYALAIAAYAFVWLAVFSVGILMLHALAAVGAPVLLRLLLSVGLLAVLVAIPIAVCCYYHDYRVLPHMRRLVKA